MARHQGRRSHRKADGDPITEIVRGDMSRGERNDTLPLLLGPLSVEPESLAVIRQASGYYEARSSCHYDLNAVTGAILKKECNHGTDSREPPPARKPGC